MLRYIKFDTSLGEMIGISDDHHLYLLEFTDYKFLALATHQIERYKKIEIAEGESAPLISIKKEITAYLNGDLRDFKTPVMHVGTEFQKLVWKALQQIPYGKTLSYAELASSIGKPAAFRATANSNGANKMIIITPCHRVIGSDGSLGGYSSDIKRKEWLLKLEETA